MTGLNILTVVGARPQFIKSAAVSRAFAATGQINEIMVHTGQHFDNNMSEVFFRELAIPPPDIHLGIHGGSHGEMTGRMLEALDARIRERRPDRVLVYGDTNSTLAGALAAAKLHVPVIHVEAGLRSFNRRMPEETNRVLTDHVSDLLFSPTLTSVENLRHEGLTAGVHHVGDVMHDAFRHAASGAARSAPILSHLGLERGGYVLATVHRAENTDDGARLAQIMAFIAVEASSRPVVLPLHPRTRAAIERHGIKPNPIRLIDPVGYFDMVTLTDAAGLVITDSGGLQKESYFARTPCITLRDETEWPETVRHGWNRLWTRSDWTARSDIPDFGDGDASDKIARIILNGA
jgi:UDP-GlcNAc3NAcA epimerase